MRNPLNKKTNAGASLIEVVIAASIISVALVSVVSVFGRFERIALANIHSLQATALAEEGVEALKFMRDAGWNANIPLPANNGTTYYLLDWDGAKWATTTTPTPVMGGSRFKRTFVLSAVCRNANHDVAACPAASTDDNSRKATVAISWTEGGSTKTKSIETYIFNLFNN